MTLVELLGELSKHGARLQLDGDSLRCNAPKGALDEPLREELAARRDEVIAFLRQAGAEAPPPIRRVERAGPAPLSAAQRRLWFLDQLQPGSHRYNEPGAIRLRGPLREEALIAALGELMRRHASLRTAFPEVDGEPVQQVLEPGALPLTRVDLRRMEPGRRERRIPRELSAFARRPFDLTRPPLVRFLLLRTGEDEHVFALTAHHIACDGWSLGVMMREVSTVYGSLATGERPSLPPQPLRFSDFAHWQSRWSDGARLDAAVEFWRRRLDGAPAFLDLPFDRPHPPASSQRGGRAAVEVSAEMAAGLRRLARERETTLYGVLMAAYSALLARFGGGGDLVLGASVANRTRLEVESLVGFFVNLLPIRVQLADDPPFAELVARVHRQLTTAAEHQELPFERLVEALAPERDPNRPPLVQAVFVLQNFPLQLEMPGLVVDRVELSTGTAKFDLALELVEEGERITGFFEYNLDVFEPGTAESLARSLERLLAGAVERPGCKVPRLPLAELPEAAAQRAGGQDSSEAAADEAADVTAMVLERAASAPDSCAVRSGAAALSYGELAARAAGLAGHLTAAGVGPEVAVALLLPRSIEFVVALLAVLRAGGAAVPLDPEQPAARLGALLDDVGAELVLASPPPAVAKAIGSRRLVDPRSVPPGDPGAAAPEAVGESLAYIIFTSGSTGRPKGVGVSHAAAAVHFPAAASTFGLSRRDRVLQFASPIFDVGLEQILAPLCRGAEVLLRGPEVWGLEEIDRCVERQLPSVLNLPTGLWRQWIGERAAEETNGDPRPRGDLRLTIAGGDTLSPAAAEQWRGSALASVALLNAYGPTEGVVTTTAYRVSEDRERPEPAVPIGRALAGRSAWIATADGDPQPAGARGEIRLGGPVLARGYVGRPGRTAERFVPDPLAAEPGARCYRTGDLGRRTASGDLVFLGRDDAQLKVCGFRIEPGEVEAAIGAHPGVSAVTVTAAAMEVAAGGGEPAAAERSLVAYWVAAPDEEIDARALGRFVHEQLPAHLCPAHWVELDELPLTAAGKVDRTALPTPQAAAGERDEGSGGIAATALERTLCRIWAEVLSCEEVRPDDDFFELGGHSLVGTRLVARIRRELDRAVPLAALFDAPTVSRLAERLRRLADGAGGEGARIAAVTQPGQAIPLAAPQRRLWFLERLEPGTTAYCVPAAFRLTGRLDRPALAAAFSALVERHTALRSVFAEEDGEPVQRVVDPSPPVELPLVDLEALPPPRRDAEVRRLIAPRAQRPFDLGRCPLLAARLLRLGERQHVVWVSIHHIVSDDWSVGIIVRELGALYAAEAARRPVRLPRPPVQYSDYALWQGEHLDGGELERLGAYWRRQLDGAPRVLELPTDLPRPEVSRSRGAVRSRELPPGLAARLESFARGREVTLYMVFLAAFEALLHLRTGVEDLVVGTSAANRGPVEAEGIVGFFVNMLVLRTELAGDPTLDELLRRVCAVVLEAVAHQEMPFDRLVEELRVHRDPNRNPLFQIAFTYESVADKTIEMPGLELAPLEIEVDTTLFDLALLVNRRAGEVTLSFRYMSDLYRTATVDALLADLQAVAEVLVDRPETRLAELGDLLEQRRQEDRRLRAQQFESRSIDRLRTIRRRAVGA